MLFNSFAYAAFLLLVFLLYWKLATKGRSWQNGLLLLASYGFYAAWDWRFLGLIVGSSLTDYLIGLRLESSSDPKRRKQLLWLSCGINLGILGVFKYYGFFAESLGELFLLLGIPFSLPSLALILPVGISFYTFQTLSYTIDIYRGELKASRDPLRFFTFVAFFPQLVAGPIERAARFLPQLAEVRTFDPAQARQGLRLLLWGLFQKMVIADQLARWVDPIYAAPESFYGPTLLLGTLGFAFQIYCDFAGYSLMAIGSAKLLGLELMTNFRRPYIARSLQEFWSRWHISLSSWFRDYVYIPLGGNQVSRLNWLRNILLTFLLSGLWHGSNATFLAWGAIHGLAYLAEAQFKRWTANRWRVPNLLAQFLTFLVVWLAWIFFRADSVSQAVGILRTLPQGLGTPVQSFFLNLESFQASFPPLREGGFLLLSFALFLALSNLQVQSRVQNWFFSQAQFVRWFAYFALASWIALFGAYHNPVPFLYFQF